MYNYAICSIWLMFILILEPIFCVRGIIILIISMLIHIVQLIWLTTSISAYPNSLTLIQWSISFVFAVLTVVGAKLGSMLLGSWINFINS